MPSFSAQADMAEMEAKARPVRVAPVEAALAEEAATQVTFRIPHPVSAPAGHSLMVPIISRDVPATRVSLYQPDTHPRHPLASLRLTNDGDTGLPPGILTLYEDTGTGTAFIGDARLAAFPAGEERLVSFAVDQKVTVDRENLQTERMTAARIADGILSVSVRERARARYTIEGAAGEPRIVLVEHPVRDGWRLVGPEGTGSRPPASTIASAPISSQARAPSWMSSRNARSTGATSFWTPATTSCAICSRPAGCRRSCARPWPRSPPSARALGERQRDLQRLEGEIAAIMEDQARLRQNLNAVPRDSDLHQRYLARMDEQEDRLADLRDQADDARTALEAARDAHRDYVRGLDL
jgi:hypothetical protein